ncbi:hypothetical protein M408DRAFT_196567 [Serendipita vermifera MAFF 305830]|uniref:Uncharacterized protein n=1 Tax=Serendipita vermifera MAFF 305830 TaxID=933852 RepID=A0A0C3ANJ3_SERVB|nr:hypothetical protein M408DRAFT_196567 [Serendipita vermifera MAFF 305830]
MPASPISYDDFQVSQGFVDSGGPWNPGEAVSWDFAWYTSPADNWCDGTCLLSRILPPAEARNYHLSYTANISVSLAQFGGATSLGFTWSYWPLYTGSNIAAGTSLAMRSQVNDISYTDTIPATDWVRFSGDHSWGSTPVLSHSGTVAVNRGASSNTGYITLVIYFEPQATTDTEYVSHFTKDISFKITTPGQNAAAASSSRPATGTAGSSGATSPSSASASSSLSSSSSSASGSSASSQSSGLSPLSPFDPSGISSSPHSGDAAATNSPGGSSQNSQQGSLSTSAKVGVAIGSIALLALLIAGFLLYRRRRAAITRWEGHEAAPVAYPPEKQGRHFSSNAIPLVEAPYSVPTTPVMDIPSPYLRTQSNPAGSTYSGSHTSDTSSSQGAPPLYGAPMSDMLYAIPPTSLALAEFAEANRDMIGTDLEMRLAIAGYVPSDDPDNLSEEEWTNVHNLTRLELMRLRSLFAARTRRIEAAQRDSTGESSSS